MSSIRNAAISFLFLMSAHAQLARAQSTLLVEAPMDNATEINTKFEVNRELGRAWIQIDFLDLANEGPMLSKTIRKAVEGLSYDPSSKSVVHRIGDKTIVCAEDAHFLWMKYLKPTGNCSIRVVTEERVVDDGFHTSKERVATVSLVPEPHSS